MKLYLVTYLNHAAVVAAPGIPTARRLLAANLKKALGDFPITLNQIKGREIKNVTHSDMGEDAKSYIIASIAG